jgi:DNA topoisomerase-1
MQVVVVESPAKAKTINKYLGPEYQVLASYGHVRDLPPKDGSVRPDQDFAMDWEVDAKAEKHIRAIAAAMKGADGLILATDPDREGEAISWHVQNELEARKAIHGMPVQRVVFNEITKSAVLDAMAHPRKVDQELVDAYLARRALDYLVGFTLSPVLWRKLPGSRSAGRVQSVALRLICEREDEVEKFRAQEYWSVEADFLTPRDERITANLVRLDGAKLDKMDLKDEASARAAEAKVRAAQFKVDGIERKQTRRNPWPPFTTSTLQQEASRKLGFTAKHTMQIAQRLYEGVDIGGETVGLITYMRTDAVNMAGEAIAGARRLIESQFGATYLPSSPRVYKTKAKNAQEAHEAIRPTDMFRMPRQVAAHLDRDQLRLYELIWKRTIACQMESAVLDQVAIDIGSADGRIGFRATGSVIKFDGFLKLYREDRDDEADDDSEKALPDVTEAEPMRLAATAAKPEEAAAWTPVRCEQHFTQPPPRYTEASLVKKLEELGIGRPSTYASIISVLQDRDYVRLDAKRFIPEDRGRVVTAFLESYFGRYVEYDFTADLENELDDISGARIDWKSVLRRFWADFSKAVDGTKDLRVSQVLDKLDEELGPHFFPAQADGKDPRVCPTCGTGRLSLKLGKFGAFIGCSRYPECRHTRPLSVAGSGDGGVDDGLNGGAKELGNDPTTGLPVTLRKGPYGAYVQLGETVAVPKPKKKPKAKKAKGKTDEKTDKDKDAKDEAAPAKPKRVSLPKGTEAASVTLEKALKLLSLPRVVGAHPETGKPITAGVGRFGPYLHHGDMYKSLPAGDDVLEIGLNRAVDLLASAKPRRAPARLLGAHPADGKPITVNAGRYGPYVSHGKTNATLPKGKTETEVTLDEAVALLAAREAKGGGPKAKGKAPARAKVASGA